MAILGIDEVGRGPLAGPLVVGAVILPEEKPEWVAELRDSKKLSEKKREKLSSVILEEAPATGLGWVANEEIDELGMSEALRLATRRAVEEAQKARVAFSQIMIDGTGNFLAGTALGKYVSTMPKADDLIKEVSAASIIAKVARDRYMVELAKKYPEYGFERHKGYGTEFHRRAIANYGVCPEHRKSFEPIKSMIGWSPSGVEVIASAVAGVETEAKTKTGAKVEAGVKVGKSVVKNTTEIGQKAETKVTEYLESLGHTIVVRNFKTKRYEIDIVSVCGEKVYFTEVKYRETDDYGGGLGAITRQKLDQMRYAAERFLQSKKLLGRYDPILAVAEVAGKDFTVRNFFSLD